MYIFSVGGKVRYPSELEKSISSDLTSATDADSVPYGDGTTRSMGIAELAL